MLDEEVTMESYFKAVQRVPTEESACLGAEGSHVNITPCTTQLWNSSPQETSGMPEVCIKLKRD